jgi:hypothetical protein
MDIKVITLSQLPKELYALYNTKHEVLLQTPDTNLNIKSMKTKSNVADIDGMLYYFGNTYGNINPYKNVKNLNDLVTFVTHISNVMDQLIKNHTTDITYLSVSDLMNDKQVAEKILTSNETVYPDYTVELTGSDYLEIEIDAHNSTITTKNKLEISKVGFFDLKRLFKMEYLNSLYIVKLAHRRDLDLKGIMNLIPQLQNKKMIDVVQIIDTHDTLTICLHIPQNLIPKVFDYKLKKRTTKVLLSDLTDTFISQTIKS